MATPEQNALLAMQLFRPAAEVVTDANDRKVALLQRFAELANAQRFQQSQAQQQQANQIQLETMRDTNQRSLEGMRTDNATKLETMRTDSASRLAKEATERQTQLEKARAGDTDTRDLRKQFALAYPVYAQAAATVNKNAKALKDYDETWEGLGELQADMSTLKEEAQSQKENAAAQGVVAILDQATQSLADTIRVRDEGMKLTASDTAAARSMGLRALQQAATNGNIPIEPKGKKWDTAIAALSKDQPDIEVAKQILGPSGFQAYASGVQQGLLALANDKERIAKVRALNADVQVAQRGASEALNKLLQYTATNPKLGPALADRNTKLQALTKTAGAPSDAPPDTQSVFKSLIGPGPAPQAPGAPTPAGTPSAGTNLPASAGPTSTYQYPGLSILGAVERANTGVPTANQFAQAPGNILAAPGRAVDAGARLIGAGVGGLFTGNYSMPPSGTDAAASGLASMFQTGPSDADQIAQIQGQLSGMTPGAGQLDTSRQIDYLRRLLESYQQRPTSSLLGQ